MIRSPAAFSSCIAITLATFSCSGKVEETNTSAPSVAPPDPGTTAPPSASGGTGQTTDPPPGVEVARTCETELNVVAVPGTAALWDRDAAAGASSDTLDFFSAPWPELGRINAEHLGFPNPASANGCEAPATASLSGLLTDAVEPQAYRAYLSELLSSETGGSRHPVIYLPFDGPVPQLDGLTALESLQQDSPAFLINVDPESEQLGERTPVESRVFTQSRYLPENTAAFTPRIGFPLKPGTRYALVIPRTGVNAALGSSAAFEALKGGTECSDAFPEYPEAFEFLNDALQLAPEEVAAMTIFQTGTPSETLQGFRDAVNGSADPNALAQVQTSAGEDRVNTESLYLVTGEYQAPLWQAGTAPYLPAIRLDAATAAPIVTLDATSDAGAFEGASIAGSDSPRSAITFTLALPVGASSADQSTFPLVIYGVGTGGSPQSPISSGIATDLARLGYAVLTPQPVMHAERANSAGIDETLLAQLDLADTFTGSNYVEQLTSFVESGDLYFNPFQLQAARGNVLQNAADYLWAAHLFASSDFTIEVGGAARTISFDTVSFFGHSQGGSTGPLLAGSEAIGSLVLSGAGGHIPSVLLAKTEPADSIVIGDMLQQIICDDPTEPLDAFHPVLAMVGRYLEPADAEFYAEDMLAEAEGMHVFMIQGRDDAYSPNEGQEAIWAEAGFHEVLASDEMETSREGQILLQTLNPGGGYASTYTERVENVQNLTGAFQEYSDPGCTDAHFVFTCDTEARSDWQTFYATSRTGSPIVQ